jgi:hypothetical protein
MSCASFPPPGEQGPTTANPSCAALLALDPFLDTGESRVCPVQVHKPWRSSSAEKGLDHQRGRVRSQRIVRAHVMKPPRQRTWNSGLWGLKKDW